MTVEEQRWREKYLQLLEQQERQEARWEQRLDLLRRSLVRSSLAVEGADPGVEQCLRKMREIQRARRAGAAPGKGRAGFRAAPP